MYCLPQGPIAIAKNGVQIYNPFTSTGENAAELEVMDCNGGHSDGDGRYHYHSLPDNGVVYNSSDGSPQFIGVAFDGNPIYRYDLFVIYQNCWLLAAICCIYTVNGWVGKMLIKMCWWTLKMSLSLLL